MNRSLCAALASAGHEVVCLVPDFLDEERDDAARQGVTLVAAPPAVGLSEEARLCLPVEIEDPDVVIGHGHVTGPVAAARAALVPGASRIHVLHTSPEELEWLKARGKDPAARSAEKQELEASLATSATVALAIGPRLARQWQTFLGGSALHVTVTRLDVGLPSSPVIPGPPPALHCLVLGRAEDYEIKGLDVAAAALGRLRRDDSYFEGAREPVLLIRGAAPGSAEELRRTLQAAAGIGLRVNIKEYTHDQVSVREDLLRASVLLLPSRAEGFGLVALEALAMGVPVLVSMRSGIGELLIDRAEANPSESFLRNLVVDIKDDIATDARAWAEALGTTLKDRTTSFRQAADLRSLLLEANYWEQSVRTVVAQLPFVEHPPAGSELDQASWWIEHDPLIAVGVAATALESELSRLAAQRGPSNLPPRLALQMIGAHGLLAPNDLEQASRLIQHRNQTVHGAAGIELSEEEARDHVRDVKVLVERIRERLAAHAAVCASIASAEHEDEWSDVLVWTSEPSLRTYWVTRANRQFTIHGERPGAFLSGGQRIWMWEQISTPITLSNQDDVARMYEEGLGSEEIERLPKVAGHLDAARLVDIESGVVAKVSVDLLGGQGGPWTMLSDTIRPTFSVGTMLFAEQHLAGFPFGAAHPMYGAHFACIDLTTGAPKSWAEPNELKAVVARLGDAAVSRLLEDPAYWEGTERPTRDRLSVSKYDASYSTDGSLHLDFLLTAWVPYAFGDGAWGAYSRSATVRSDDVPALLDGFRRLPEAVRWFIEAQPPCRFGWTAVEPARRDELLKAFQERKNIAGLVEYSLHRV